MKTIQVGAKISRVSDKEAEKLVEAGKAKYITKSAWKKQVRDVGHSGQNK